MARQPHLRLLWRPVHLCHGDRWAHPVTEHMHDLACVNQAASFQTLNDAVATCNFVLQGATTDPRVLPWDSWGSLQRKLSTLWMTRIRQSPTTWNSEWSSL